MSLGSNSWCPVDEIQWDFYLEDFRNRMRLAFKIWKRSDLVSQYLWVCFSNDTTQLFEELGGPMAGFVENPLIQALINELNKVLERTDVYDADRFADIQLRDEIAPLLALEQPTSEERM